MKASKVSLGTIIEPSLGYKYSISFLIFDQSLLSILLYLYKTMSTTSDESYSEKESIINIPL